MEIRIPERFYKSLDSDWSAIISRFIKNVGGILAQKPYFFPEYTEHNFVHVNNVLDITDKIIPNETMGKLSSPAVGILIMAVISHDIGMFLMPDGLKSLLADSTWRKRWNDYGFQLRHFSDADIRAYFGEKQGSDRLEIPQDFDRLTKWEILICGEFLRRYHPLLAQDILEKGFYGYETQDLLAGINIHSKERYCKLIGLIARSHGMSMDKVDSILYQLDSRRPEMALQVPVYYLMSLLRLADYVDAGADRAPHAVLNMQHFDSKLSYEEFQWNSVVCLQDDWGRYGDEIEYIEIETKGITSKTFLKIENWMKSIQNELDICWRYLSLKYRNQYQLTIRSFDSNLLQEKSRQEVAAHVVIEPAVLCANPNITELMIAPLYGSNPTYGVRELLQNAVDACLERKVLEQKRGSTNYEGNITIELNSDSISPYFCITDNGIGMTQEVILHYYLTAGASYRENPNWKEQFGEEHIFRAGRFGVGVLAAFLLGSKIQIETLPIGEDKAYCFDMECGNYEQINIVRKSPQCAELKANGGGTYIRIEMKQTIADRMITQMQGLKGYGWTRWYWLSLPNIYYIINKTKYQNQSTIADLEFGLQENGDWNQLNVKNPYVKLYWKYGHHSLDMPSQRVYDNPYVFCNGMLITKNSPIPSNRTDLCIKSPSISVMDSQNAVDLNLKRDKLLSLPEHFSEELYLECCMQAIAALVMYKVNSYNIPFFETSPIFMYNRYSISMKRLWHALEGRTLWILSRNKKTFSFQEDMCNRMDVFAFNEFPYIPSANFLRNQIVGKGVNYEEFEKLPYRQLPPYISTKQYKEANGFYIPSGIITDPEMEMFLTKYLGDESWIPIDLAMRKKKFPRFFDQNDEIFKYVKRACEEEACYSLETILKLP